jgi:hypothetical protein
VSAIVFDRDTVGLLHEPPSPVRLLSRRRFTVCPSSKQAQGRSNRLNRLLRRGVSLAAPRAHEKVPLHLTLLPRFEVMQNVVFQLFRRGMANRPCRARFQIHHPIVFQQPVVQRKSLTPYLNDGGSRREQRAAPLRPATPELTLAPSGCALRPVGAHPIGSQCARCARQGARRGPFAADDRVGRPSIGSACFRMHSDRGDRPQLRSAIRQILNRAGTVHNSPHAIERPKVSRVTTAEELLSPASLWNPGSLGLGRRTFEVR